MRLGDIVRVGLALPLAFALVGLALEWSWLVYRSAFGVMANFLLWAAGVLSAR